MADTDIKYTPPRVKSPILEKMKNSPGGPGGPGTPGAKKEIERRKKPSQKNIAGMLKATGGLAALLKENGADEELVKTAEMIESMPGGNELLYTMAGEELIKKAGGSPKDAKKVRLYCYGGYVEQAFAKGGAVKAAAARTRNAGRGEDSMMLHMSPEEYQVIEAMWGPAEINPNTGIGEYGFLSKIWKKVKSGIKKIFKSKIFQTLAPIALSMFAPGLGTAIGGMLGASGAAAPIVGNALLRGGLSAAGGGDFMTGAVTGAISGGLGDVVGSKIQGFADISDSTASVLGSALAGGTGSAITGGDFAEGAVMGGLTQMMQPTLDKVTESGQGMFGRRALTDAEIEAGGIMAPKLSGQEQANIAAGRTFDLGPPEPSSGLEPGEMGPPAPPPPGYGEPGTELSGPPGPAPGATPAGGAPPAGTPAAPSNMDNIIKYGLPLMTAMGAVSGGGEEAEPIGPYTGGNFNEPMPDYKMNRQFTGMDPNAYYTYGQPGAAQSGQHLFTDPRPFGDPNQPAAGPTGGLGVQGGDQIAALIEQGAPVPFQLVRGGGQRLVSAGYTKDTNTGTWMPPPPELGQGMGQAMGGYQGGGETRFVSGAGTGRSDDIPARLSDGEYVIDAETVALLGDGSGKSGAARLDEMRQNLRKHKAKNLSKGGFSHKAKSPQNYMGRLRAAAGAV